MTVEFLQWQQIASQNGFLLKLRTQIRHVGGAALASSALKCKQRLLPSARQGLVKNLRSGEPVSFRHSHGRRVLRRRPRRHYQTRVRPRSTIAGRMERGICRRRKGEQRPVQFFCGVPGLYTDVALSVPRAYHNKRIGTFLL